MTLTPKKQTRLQLLNSSAGTRRAVGRRSTTIPVIYGYARVSESDRDDLNLETQILDLARYSFSGRHSISQVP